MTLGERLPERGETVLNEHFTGPVEELNAALRVAPAALPEALERPAVERLPQIRNLVKVDKTLQVRIPTTATLLAVAVESEFDPSTKVSLSSDLTTDSIEISPRNVVSTGAPEVYVNSLIPANIRKSGPFLDGALMTITVTKPVTMRLIWR